jgi:hypothetical protein
MFEYLSKSASGLFFKECADLVQKLISWHRFTFCSTTAPAATLIHLEAAQPLVPPQPETPVRARA